MKRPRPERSRSTDDTESPWDDVYGIVLLMLAAMYFLALMSYDPGDLPGWAHLVLSDQPNTVTHNFIGQIGAIVAGYSLFLMGLAAYFIPVCLTWLGVCKLASHMKITRLTWAGVALLIISGSSLMAANHLFEWQDGHLPHGGGGGLGRLVGETVFEALLGRVGATLVLGVVYAIGLFLVTKIHPMRLLEELRQEVPRWLESLRAHYAVAGGAALQDLPAEAPPAPRARRKKAPVEEPEEETEPPLLPLSSPELPLQFAPPPPKIIDSSERRPHGHSDDKPKLAEVWGKKRAQKIEQAPHGSLGSLTVRFKDYVLPDLDLLNWPEDIVKPADKDELLGIQKIIVRTLASFGITVEPGDITRGPAITRYEVRPADGLRVSRIANLDADIARATRAEKINILAPIPGKDTVGIELANKDKIIVPIRELLEDDIFQNGKAKIPIALGKDVYGKTIIGDLAAMPHLLVAGATGSGKSVCINGIVTSLLCRFAPDELRFIMIDPKVVEMQNYEQLPHLALPVVTDPKKALLALRWVVKEMENRYQIFAQEGCRNFEAFNNRNRKRAEKAAKARAAGKSAAPAASPLVITADEAAQADNPLAARDLARLEADLGFPPQDDADEEAPARVGNDWSSDATPPPPRRPEMVIPDTLPYIVVIIDELADLMQTAPADIEGAIARITQMARAAGIHLIVATQTPRADVITGVIKANIPTRIAFQVASALDSRVILDRKGAENLVGKGDMLYVPPGGAQPIRAQGALVTDDEIHALVERCVAQGQPLFDVPMDENGGEFGEEGEEGGLNEEEEAVLEDCLDIIRQERKASTSLFQRRLRLGYGRAARMMDILEDRGIIGPQDGVKPREILVNLD